MRRYIAFIIMLAACSTSWGAESDKNFSGEVRLLSHYVEYGLSQSNKSPALQGDFWFNLGPQFRAGVAGSSVNYENTNEHFNLQLKADLKIEISTISELHLNYAKSQYYDQGHRNGNILGVHLKLWDYRVTYDSFSNWEGTEHASSRFGFGKKMTVLTNWTWDTEVGYNTPDVSSISSYFDARTGLGRKFGPIFLEGSVTGTSAGSDFEHGEGDFFFILSAMAEL